MREQRIEAARQCARQLLHRFGVVAPEHIRIEAFAAMLGIQILTVRLDGCDAQLVRNGLRVTILVSDRNTDPGKRRFDIAHEIGHFLLGHPTRIPARIPGPETPGGSIYEKEASAFASELLMPERLVRSECDLSRVDLGVPKQIARHYNVSILTSAIRFTELAREPCAAVFSVANKMGTGKIKWVAQSASFEPHITWGKPLSPSSVASGFFVRGELDETPHDVPPAAWFDAAANVRLIEHATCSREHRTVLSMLWVQRDAT